MSGPLDWEAMRQARLDEARAQQEPQLAPADDGTGRARRCDCAHPILNGETCMKCGREPRPDWWPTP